MSIFIDHSDCRLNTNGVSLIFLIIIVYLFVWGFISCWNNYQKSTAIISLILAAAAYVFIPVYLPLKYGVYIAWGILSFVMIIKGGDAFETI